MVDVKTEGKERETDDLKAKLEEEGNVFIHLRVEFNPTSASKIRVKAKRTSPNKIMALHVLSKTFHIF